MLAVSLLTLGSPDQLTGGYLYHCRMAELASQHDAHLDLVSVPALPFPLPAAAAGRAPPRAAARPVLGGGRIPALMLASQTLLPQMSGFRTVVVAPGRDVAAPPSGPPVDLRRGRRGALLSVGNWVDRKGTLDLLDAFGRLEPGLATLHLVGRT